MCGGGREERWAFSVETGPPPWHGRWPGVKEELEQPTVCVPSLSKCFQWSAMAPAHPPLRPTTDEQAVEGELLHDNEQPPVDGHYDVINNQNLSAPPSHPTTDKQVLSVSCCTNYDNHQLTDVMM